MNKRFFLRNVGNDPLTIFSFENPPPDAFGTAWVYVYPPATPIILNAGEQIELTVAFIIRIPSGFDGYGNAPSVNGDSDAGFNITGTIRSYNRPELEVFRGTPQDAIPVVAETDLVDFGTAAVGDASDAIPFIVANLGNQDLGPLAISLPDGFRIIPNEIITRSDQTLVPDTNTEEIVFSSIQIQMEPDTPGTHQGTMTVFRNDEDDDPFRFTITGTVSGLGDFNGDNLVDAADIDLMRDAVDQSTSNPEFDVNGTDGDIPDDNDFDFLIEQIIGTEHADGDLNKLVNFQDFVLVSNNFNQIGTGWLQGNFNFYFVTNFDDFVILSNNFGTDLTSTATNSGQGAVQSSEMISRTLSASNLFDPRQEMVPQATIQLHGDPIDTPGITTPDHTPIRTPHLGPLGVNAAEPAADVVIAGAYRDLIDQVVLTRAYEKDSPVIPELWWQIKGIINVVK